MIGLIAALLLGCGDGDVLCAPSRGIAVAVDVRDATSEQSLVTEALGVAAVGSLSDSLRIDLVSEFPDSVLVGGVGTGSYEVRVEAAGYALWDTTGVHVRLSGGECPDLIIQPLTAQLQPE
jgi:hypothetical protein